MKVFTNGKEFFVAIDKVHLKRLYADHHGRPIEGKSSRSSLGRWKELNEEAIISIAVRADFDLESLQANEIRQMEEIIEDHEILVSAPVREWAKSNGEGLLCIAPN